jgi:UDP-glucose 4-epimerase
MHLGTLRGITDVGNTVIVLGSSGYIGAHLVNYLILMGMDVVGIDKNPYPGRVPDRFFDVQLDISEEASLKAIILESGASAIFHLATSSNMSLSFVDKEKYLLEESEKIRSLISAASSSEKCKFVIQASSCSVYGDVESGSAMETHERSPQSPYAFAKVVCEDLLGETCASGGFSAAALRFFNVIGRDPNSDLGEHHEPESHILPLALEAAKERRPFSIFGQDFDTFDGTAIRDYVDVRDICRGLFLAMRFLEDNEEVSFRAWNLGSDVQLSVRGLLEQLGQILDSPIEITFQKRRAGDPARAVANIDRAREELDWHPTYGFRDSVLSLIS